MATSLSKTLTTGASLQQVKQFLNSGLLAQAEQLCLGILQANPTHAEAHYCLGVIADRRGKPVDCLQHLAVAVDATPNNPQFVLTYAQVLVDSGRIADALDCLVKAMSRGVNNSSIRKLRHQCEELLSNSGGSQKDPPPQVKQAVVSLFSAGRFAELETQLQVYVSSWPDSGFIWKALGAAAQAMGKDSLAPMLKAAELLPNDTESHVNLAIVQRELGAFADAKTTCLKAITLAPNNPAAHCNLGLIELESGQMEAAIPHFRYALSLKPDYVEANVNLGGLLLKQSNYDEALQHLRRAIFTGTCRTTSVYLSLGNSLHDVGEYKDAINALKKAISLDPDCIDAHNSLGSCLVRQGRYEEASAHLKLVLTVQPDNALTLVNLGCSLMNAGNLAEAVTSLRSALDLDPTGANTHFNLGLALRNLGQLGEAEACFRQAATRGYPEARFHEALLTPAIMTDWDSIVSLRAQATSRLDKLLADIPTISNPLIAYPNPVFYLAFHGVSNKNLQVQLAQVFEKAHPSLLYSAPHCLSADSPRTRNKIRVGFLSRFILNHSIARCFTRVVSTLTEHGDFETFMFSHCATEIPGSSFVQLPLDLVRARNMIAERTLDVLVYLDIGMDPLNYFLAFARLAPVQCVLGGHPDTTGITNMDYFISGAVFEPTGAQSHYSEKLVTLPVGLFYFERPALPAVFKTRQDFDLPKDATLYICPVKLQKIHPDFDEAIAGILKLDSRAVIVFFEDDVERTWHTLLQERFEKKFSPDLCSRIRFLPWLYNYTDFISMCKLADVVLDPFHFGIGSTGIAVFSVGTPIVTKPGALMRGRIGLGYCHMLGIPECVATNTDDYVRLSVEIANNKLLHASITEKILANSHVLFDNRKPIDDFVAFLMEATT